jgi:uridine kinase
MTIQELVASKPPKTGEVRFVAVDGRGGSGKSTLAELLAKQLDAQIIHTDDFASRGNPKNWWPSVIEHVFKPIAQDAKTLNYERSKWWENHHPKPAVDQPVTPIMILEGVSSFRKEFRNYISLRIFVDTPKEICMQRGLERDTSNNTGKTEHEIKRLWEEWQQGEDDYLTSDQPVTSADIVLDGSRPFMQQLAEL